MTFMTDLSILKDKKPYSHNLISVLVDQLIKIVYYKLVKILISRSGLAKIIIYMIITHYNLTDSILNNRNVLFNSKFLSSLFYFLIINQKLFITFYIQIYNVIER